MRVLGCDEVHQAEREAISRSGGSALVLMQRAGYAVMQFCLANFKFNSACVVCGTGTNGGRGLAAAQCLKAVAADLSVIILAKDASELCPDAATMLSNLAVKPIWLADDSQFADAPVQEALQADLLLDAIIDSGSEESWRAVAQRAVQEINNALGIVVAIDLPSGVGPDDTRPLHERDGDMVMAHGIIALIGPRPAHVFGELTSGPIAVCEIGVQPTLVSNQTGLQVVTGQEVGIVFSRPSTDAHLSAPGHVLVFGGSKGRAGAVSLTAMAALRAGARSVTVACPESVAAAITTFAPELIVEGLPETSEGRVALEAAGAVEALFEGKAAVVLGPGLAGNPATKKIMRQLVSRCPLPLLFEADAMSGELSHGFGPAPIRVLALNSEEAIRLMPGSGDETFTGRIELARSIAKAAAACVVLKGQPTIVAGVSGETWINLGVNLAVDKAGYWEVLSGIIGAAIARRTTPGPSTSSGPLSRMQQDSAQVSAFLEEIGVVAAAYLHSLAVDRACSRLHKHSVVASDLLAALPEAFKECEVQMDQGMYYLQK